MLIAGITIRFIFGFLAAVVVAACIYAIRHIARLKRRLNTSLVLIPLYKSKAGYIVSAFIVLGLMALNIVAMALGRENLFNLIIVFIMLSSILALFIAMMTQRYAVVDSGIIVPLKYLDWIEFRDYAIEGNTVYFTGDRHGFSSISSTTLKMYFNSSDLNKLKLILSRNKTDSTI
jgi:cytochrome c oxidase subunit IV